MSAGRGYVPACRPRSIISRTGRRAAWAQQPGQGYGPGRACATTCEGIMSNHSLSGLTPWTVAGRKCQSACAGTRFQAPPGNSCPPHPWLAQSLLFPSWPLATRLWSLTDVTDDVNPHGQSTPNTTAMIWTNVCWGGRDPLRGVRRHLGDGAAYGGRGHSLVGLAWVWRWANSAVRCGGGRAQLAAAKLVGGNWPKGW